MKITANELATILGRVKGTRPVTFTAHTLTKKGAEKRARINGMIGVDYEAGVNRRLAKSGSDPNFTAQEPTWGSGGPVVVTHNNETYLRVNVGRTLEKRFFKDGVEVSPEDAGDTGRDSVGMKLRKYAMKNIRNITIDGTTYTVIR